MVEQGLETIKKNLSRSAEKEGNSQEQMDEALARGRIDPATAADLAQLDEVFQADRWGHHAEAVRRRERVRSEIAESAQFLNLLG